MAAVGKMFFGKFQELCANSSATQFSDDSDDRDIWTPQEPSRVMQYKSSRSIEFGNKQCASRPLQYSRAGIEGKTVPEPRIVVGHDLSAPSQLGLGCNADLHRFRHSVSYEVSGASKFVAGEEEAEFKARRLIGIRTVDRVALNVGAPLLADRTLLGIGRVSRPHQRAQIGDGVFLL